MRGGGREIRGLEKSKPEIQEGGEKRETPPKRTGREKRGGLPMSCYGAKKDKGST